MVYEPNTSHQVVYLQINSSNISTKSDLHKFGININCPFCKQENKEIDHIFKTCDFTKTILTNLDGLCQSAINLDLIFVMLRAEQIWNNKFW